MSAVDLNLEDQDDSRDIRPINPLNRRMPTGLDYGDKIDTKIQSKAGSLDIDDYFSGPADPTKHSKLPYFLRVHGSILPKMVLPMLFIGGWATCITCISKYVHNLKVDSVLLTVLGFVVGLSLSFRSSTAYERYNEGRKFWASMLLHSRNIARVIWIHVEEREGEQGKEDLLGKLTAVNMVIAYAQAVKHKLRHEPEYDYADMKSLVENLDTFAKDAHADDIPADIQNQTSSAATWAEYLGVPFVETNPRSQLKKYAKHGIHHGNLPLEIMSHLSGYLRLVINNKTFNVSVCHTQAFNSMTNMLDAFGGCERVLATPLPIAYNIAISQITWLYVMVLPFQLYPKLDWVTIPGTIVAAYIILGIAAIGREIENPFGTDVNDLDLDGYCAQLAHDLNILTARPAPTERDFLQTSRNMPLWPYSLAGYTAWTHKPKSEIIQAAKHRVGHAVGKEGNDKRVGGNDPQSV